MTDTLSLAKKSIKMALAGNWQEAETINKQIVNLQPENIEALLRLAKAYTNLNKLPLAKKTYKKVLKLDRYNPIAKRNITRLGKIKNGLGNKIGNSTSPFFIEEPGKTKSVCLIRVTDEQKLATLEIGEPVNLVVNPRSISATTTDNQYLGRMPDDLAFRLIQLVRGGNRYKACIRLVEKNRLQIFVKEIKRSKRNNSIPSFPLKSDREEYRSFLPAEILENQTPLIMGHESPDENPEDDEQE